MREVPMRLFTFCFLLPLLSACAAAAPAATNTSTATPSPAASTTFTPTPSPTWTETATPSPSATPERIGGEKATILWEYFNLHTLKIDTTVPQEFGPFLTPLS